MLYDLRRADVRIKWLVTGLLATLGLSYVFGAVMVALYAGFTPTSVAAPVGARPDRPPVCGALARLRRHVAHQARLAAVRDRDPRRWVGDGRRLSHYRGVGRPPDVVVTRKELTDELVDSRGVGRRVAPHHSGGRAGQAPGRRAGSPPGS